MAEVQVFSYRSFDSAGTLDDFLDDFTLIFIQVGFLIKKLGIGTDSGNGISDFMGQFLCKFP